MSTRNQGAAPLDATSSLRRVLGLTEVTAGGVGIIIGAGIYVLLGAATAHAGSLVWVAFLFAAVLSALTGLSYAELSSMFPSAAGEYEYTRRALPEWVAFVIGWTMIVGLVVAAATVSLGFGRYVALLHRDRFSDSRGRAVGGGLYGSDGRCQAVGSTHGGAQRCPGRGAGNRHCDRGAARGRCRPVHGAGVAGVLGAAALVFFAFIGFDEVVTLAEETRDPTQTVPRALLLALGSRRSSTSRWPSRP